MDVAFPLFVIEWRKQKGKGMKKRDKKYDRGQTAWTNSTVRVAPFYWKFIAADLQYY